MNEFENMTNDVANVLSTLGEINNRLYEFVIILNLKTRSGIIGGGEKTIYNNKKSFK